MKRKTIAAVVGLGHMGNKINDILEQFQIESVTVDPYKSNADFKIIESIPDTLLPRISYWFVCVPTSLHYTITRSICHLTDSSKIMVEKPLSHEADLKKFSQLALQYNSHVLRVNNHYEDCQILKRASSLIDVDITRIELEFCKNRSLDIANGRFVDDNFHIWGYEGFHILFLLSFFLRNAKRDNQRVVSHDLNSFQFDTNSISNWSIARSIIDDVNVSIKLSINGLSFKEKDNYLKPSQRKRRITIELENGHKIVLGFGESFTTSYKPCQEYWIKYYNHSGELTITKRIQDNPLKTHIGNFIMPKTNVNSSNFLEGWELTRQLSEMAKLNMHSLALSNKD